MAYFASESLWWYFLCRGEGLHLETEELEMCERSARSWFGATTVLAGGLALFSAQLPAQSGCDDLGGQAVTPDVDFDSQIQPVFNNSCTSCHTAAHPTGLDLTEGQSHGNLVDVASSQDGSWIRVVPSDLEDSLLFHKINCDDPPVGQRMPLAGTALSLQQQALFRDWIDQGAQGGPLETFSIGGVVADLEGSGLVLQNNGGDDLAIASDGPFTFTTELEDGETYDVTVFSHPENPSQTCEVSNGGGTISGADVTDVEVDCVIDTFTVGGTISGLEGTGLVLQNNGGDDLAVDENGSFTFAAELPQGQGYEVTVSIQPEAPNQSCLVENGTGTMPAENVDDIVVECFAQDPDIFEDRFEEL